MNKIYINARFLTQPITGVQRFASEISKQLRVLLPEAKFVAPKNILHHELAKILETETFGMFEGHFWEQTELPLFLIKRGCPLLVNLANTGPVFYSNTIVTIHDLSIFMFPKAYSWKFYQTYKRLLPLLAKKAKRIVTVSEGVKEKLISFLNIPQENIVVVYNAASHMRNFKESEQLFSNYILTVASFNPIKNLPALIEAFTHINDKDVKLLLVGAGQKSFSAQTLVSANLNERIVFTGHIGSISELTNLYSNAKAFVFPSRYESFGIPNLEAMTCGCPVITSDVGSIREVCEDAAIYVDPSSPTDITRGINLLLSDKALCLSLIERGYARSAFFSWEKSGIHFLNVIKSLQ